MNREMRRKQKKSLKTKLSEEQFKRLTEEANSEYVENELRRERVYYQALLTESLVEAMERNGVSKSKMKVIVEDLTLIVERKLINNGKL